MIYKNENKTENMKVLKKEKDSNGHEYVVLQKGTKKVTRLDHKIPSSMRSEE